MKYSESESAPASVERTKGACGRVDRQYMALSVLLHGVRRFWRTVRPRPSRSVPVLLAVTLAGCNGGWSPGLAVVEQHPQTPTLIYSVSERGYISADAMYDALHTADYALFGEVHDDPVHHRLQRELLDSMIRKGRRPTVVFEMFNRKDEGLIATATRSEPRDADRVADAVDWQASGWPDWQMYRPIVQTALSAGLPIAAGNYARPRLRQLAFGEGWTALGKRTLQQYGLLQPLPAAHEQQLQSTLRMAHGGHRMSQRMVAGMLKAQRLRDASMADAMIARNQGDGAVLIAGREHARLDYGVPYYLRYREPGSKIVSIAFVDGSQIADVEQGVIDAAAHDFLWVLPETSGFRTAHE